jgi:hypothetical protein
VSVALVTNRADFAEDALANFLRQAYPNRELVVVVNADTALLEQWHALAAGRPEIRLCHAPGQTLGACRNRATSAARGEFVAMFDDDDLYGPEYLSEAVAVLQTTGAAMVTKLEYLWLDGELGIFLFSRPRDEWAHALTAVGACMQVFRRTCHGPEFGATYGETAPGEDYEFSRAVAARGGFIVASGPGHYVRRRNLRPGHAHTWNGRLGSFRLEDHERLNITAEQAYGLAGISPESIRPAAPARHPG